MKLLYFSSDFTIGLTALCTDQAIALHKAGIPMISVAGDKDQEEGLTQKMWDAGINLIRINDLDTHNDLKIKARKIKEIIDKHEVKVVHVQNNWQLVIMTYCRYVLCVKVKIVYTIHAFRHNHPIKSVIARLLICTLLLLFADKVICMCSYLHEKFRLLSYKIEILPLGVSDSFYDNREWNLSSNSIRAMFAAQFREGKNQQVLIGAFARYLKATDDSVSRLYLPGSGPLLPKMQELVNELGVSEQVIFPGQCSKQQVYDLYVSCNIGLISSNSETFGQCIVEPFVLGLCLVTRKVGIASDIVKEGVNGFYFNDEDQLYEVFMKLGADKQKILLAGQENWKNRDLFSWRCLAEKYKRDIWDALSV